MGLGDTKGPAQECCPNPLIWQCGPCNTFENPATWEIVASGFSGSCDAFNGSYTLSNQGGYGAHFDEDDCFAPPFCWVGGGFSTWSMATPLVDVTLTTYDTGLVKGFQVTFKHRVNGCTVVYRNSIPSFPFQWLDCQTPNVLTLFSNSCGCTAPASITVTPQVGLVYDCCLPEDIGPIDPIPSTLYLTIQNVLNASCLEGGPYPMVKGEWIGVGHRSTWRYRGMTLPGGCDFPACPQAWLDFDCWTPFDTSGDKPVWSSWFRVFSNSLLEGGCQLSDCDSDYNAVVSYNPFVWSKTNVRVSLGPTGLSPLCCACALPIQCLVNECRDDIRVNLYVTT